MINKHKIDLLVEQYYGIKRATRSIGQAMRVFQKLRDSGRYCCLVINSDFHYCWDVRLTKYVLNDHRVSLSVSSTDLLLAICFTALYCDGRVSGARLSFLGGHVREDKDFVRIVI